jgi:hypothetical protein
VYAGDWCPTRIPCLFAAHGLLKLTRSFSRDQPESLQRILNDVVENIINLSPRRVGIRFPAEDDIDCVVPGEVSVSKAYKINFNMKTISGHGCIVNSYPQQLYCITSLHPLGYHLATSALRNMIKGTLYMM